MDMKLRDYKKIIDDAGARATDKTGDASADADEPADISGAKAAGAAFARKPAANMDESVLLLCCLTTSANASRILLIVGRAQPATPEPTRSCHAAWKFLAHDVGHAKATFAKNSGVIRC